LGAVAGRRRRADSDAEGAVVFEAELKLPGGEEVLGVVVAALALPFVVNAFVPVSVCTECAGCAVEARDQGGNVFVRMHDHAERLTVLDVELPVHERIGHRKFVNRTASDQRTKSQVDRLAQSLDRVPDPNRIGTIFEPKLASHGEPAELVGPTG
jgi:hypothetical protein